MNVSPHVVAIGGGGGASQVLRAVQPFAERLTAIMTRAMGGTE